MKRLRILLVEDCPSDVRLIRDVLREVQADVDVEMIVARDGVEAMEYLHNTENGSALRPDIVLLDLNLPRKNGAEVLSEIKNSPTLKQIPVLVMSGSQADEDIQLAYSLNANCYITKPFDLAEYHTVVKSIENFWLATARLPQKVRSACQSN